MGIPASVDLDSGPWELQYLLSKIKHPVAAYCSGRQIAPICNSPYPVNPRGLTRLSCVSASTQVPIRGYAAKSKGGKGGAAAAAPAAPPPPKPVYPYASPVFRPPKLKKVDPVKDLPEGQVRDNRPGQQAQAL